MNKTKGIVEAAFDYNRKIENIKRQNAQQATLRERIEAIEARLTPPGAQSDVETFGARLRRLRPGTLRDMAKGVGISVPFLSDLENNKRTPSAATLHRLARTLGVSMDYLWTGE